VIALVLAAAVLAPAQPALADTVPSRQRARSYFVRKFPVAAPKALLKDQRALVYKARRLRVVPARACRRGPMQVRCRFVVRLVPRKRAPASFGRIVCRGELWGKLRAGRMIGRVGDYTCVPA